MNELASTLGSLWTAIDNLDRDIPAELAAVPDVQSSLILLGLLRNARKQLQTVEGYVEHACADRMGEAVFDGPGVHAIRRQTAEKTEWDHPGLATAVLTAALVDENGELPDEAQNLAACRVKEALVACAGIGYWRTGKLKEYKIDPADYRKRIPGRFTVDVTLGDDAEAAA
jgi:hypothetical protein